MIDLALDLVGLQPGDKSAGEVAHYSSGNLRRDRLSWDRVVKSSHPTNCWYQRACNFNLYVKDGIVLREEQVGNYPPPNDPSVPDPNPRGCQKGVCYAQRMYDPTRIKYPLKRVGKRGQGRWQRVRWDQALTEIADKVIDVLAADGPEVVLNAGGTRVHSQGSEGMGPNAFFEALGVPHPSVNGEIGDDHQGVGITLGKIMFADSADNWFHADTILVWGANPAYTNIPNFHYIAEARYHGTRVIAVSPDYNASAVHADLWVPVNIGTDAALALGAAQVIIRDKLHRDRFVREQTDLPLLVRDDNGKFLREKDLKSGGREDVFYFYDETSARVVEAPRKSLALNGLVPALEGVYEVRALSGTVKVRPAFALLRRWLDDKFTPEKAGAITGVSPALIERFAREIATAGGVVNISAGNWGKFYHGDLIERAILIPFAFSVHCARQCSSFSMFTVRHPDTARLAW